MLWYEDDVKRLERSGEQIAYKGETIFYGSSTIRMWAGIQTDLPQLQPVNLGFGGSTLAACVWFFNRLMQNYQPKQLVVYAGDNDLSDGRHAEEVFIFFQQLTVVSREIFGDMPCYFISLKPSVSRWHLADKFKLANSLIEKEIAGKHPNWTYVNIFSAMLDMNGSPKRELFLEDGLHLNSQGYALWKTIISEKIKPDC
jgi:lysophospholipase L1-like esterase